MSVQGVSPSAASTGPGETKGLSWMATAALVYACSAMIASIVSVANVALLASDAGVGALFVALSWTSLLGAVGWIMALPALVVLSLGLYELGRVPGAPRSAVRRGWMSFAVGLALFVVTIPLVLSIATAPRFDLAVLYLQSGVGLASAAFLLWAAVEPALRRGPHAWSAPGRVAVLLGIGAIVLEGSAVVLAHMDPTLPVLANWPPIAWGFPASLAVLASSFALFLAYSSLAKAAEPKGSPRAPGVTGAP